MTDAERARRLLAYFHRHLADTRRRIPKARFQPVLDALRDRETHFERMIRMMENGQPAGQP